MTAPSWRPWPASIGGVRGVRLLIFWVAPYTIVVLAFLYLHWGPMWHRPELDSTTPVRASEWVQWASDSLLPAAVSGGIGFTFLRPDLGWRRVPLWYWLLALVLGGVGWVMMWVLLALGHIDCGADCAPSVPTYAATAVFNRAAAILCFAPPTIALTVGIVGRVRDVHRRRARG